MLTKIRGVIYALTAMGYKSLGPLFDGQEPESRFEVPSMTVAQAMKIFNGKDSKARDDLSDELFYACLDAKIFDLAAEWISKQTIGQLLHNYKGKIDTSYRDRLKHLVNQGLLSVKVENQATYYRACSFSSPPPSPEPARTAEPSLMTPEVAAEAIEVVEPPQVEPIEAIAEVVKPPGANAVADVASDLVLTNQEFYECIQSGKPGKEGQFHYSGWGSLDRSLREVIRKLNAAGLLDNRHEAISKGLASGHPGEWPWSDIEIAFECLTGGSIPGQRKIVNNKPVLVKPRSGSGSRSTPASPPYSNPVKAEVVPVDSVAIVPAPPPVPLAATDEAMDLSGLTPEDLLYNEVKRNYVLRKFDQRAARRILDQVCQSVGRVLPWLEIDGEYYIPTDSVAELYGVEPGSVNVNYNRKLSLFSPITRKFEGQNLVNLKSHLNSLRVIDSESITLREFEKAVNMTRHLIGYTALAVLQMSNISETSMARTINMAIITALSEIFPSMERAAAMGKSQLGQTITNADIAELACQQQELACQQQQIIKQNDAMMAELKCIKSGVNDIRSCLGSFLYDNLQKLLGEMVSNFFQAEQWLINAKKIEDLVAAHADLNSTVRELVFDVQSMLKAKRAYVTELVENDHIRFLWEHDLYRGKCPVSYEQIVGEVDGEVVALKDSTGKKLGQPDHNFQVNRASHAMTWFVSASVNQRLNHDEAYRDEVQTRFKVYQEDLRKWLTARDDTGQQQLKFA